MAERAEAGVTGRPGWGRQRIIAGVRICFGIAWAVDAGLKWLPGFVDKSFLSTMEQSRAGQPEVIRAWIDFWIGIVAPAPHAWGYVLAVLESLVALCVLAGALTNLVCVAGGILSFVIWTAAEGLGGPYVSGATDVDASIIYIFMFAILAATSAGSPWTMDDDWLRARLGRFGWLCARPVRIVTVDKTGPDQTSA